MAGTVQFNRNYAAFGNQVEPYEKSDDVGLAVTEMLAENRYLYPIGALINAKISGIWLGEGERPVGDKEDLDLLFKMAFPDVPFIEIILRSKGNPARYGGWALGDKLEVTDEIVNGHRVLIGSWQGEALRFEFNLDNSWYGPVSTAGGARVSTAAARNMYKGLRR